MPSLRSSTCSRDSTSSSSANKKSSVFKKNATTAKNGEGTTAVVVTAQVRISERLNRAVEAVSQTKNRSPELVPLTADWEITKKKLRLVVSLAKDYADTTRKMNTSRNKFVMHLGLLSEKSPLFDDVGKPLNGESTQILQTIREDPTTNSTLAATQGIVNEREYNDRVVDYAIEWEKTVLEQVESELKKVRKLQGDRSYYEKKVDTLRQKANNLEEKGKTIPPSQEERLERNETKLKEAFVVHEKEAGRLCVLIEEVTSNGWKDLYHLVKNYCKWESNRVSRETDIYSELSTTIDSMKSTYKINSKKKDL
ncbi:hypothetical protein FRACYDRAFT_184089 [Fragilariopsis cylindrus CCMP1102]|uniref:BAR domain-containing protein n=1 Tax=Fragilariopsis cylindrus CCMP1102 TaxID=635003 RepID=A0A1E7FGI6_9STRA|nr:hypothetical protein FRACYDRAFT_184089 [Fragilariopsis cylindrus CCMP1102]|eukprot:OEU17291.1 hypothetical protein FRACYDRAFT_184089 [Fragilariopsis cylindrus CCMP1102]